MEEETSTSHVAGWTPWPAGLRALEEKREMEKEEEERERGATQQPQEEQR